MNDPQATQQSSPSTPPGTVSALAVVAMVLACIPCVSALGAIIALIAWKRIRYSQGRLVGRRLCLAAALVGVALTFLTFWAAQRFAEWQQQEQEQDMALVLDRFFHATSTGDTQVAIAQWSSVLTSIDPAEVSTFTSDIQARFGNFESVRIGSSQPVSGPSLLELRVECWIIARFDSVEHNGSARFALKPVPNQFTLQPELLRISFEQKDGSVIRLPVADQPQIEETP